MIESTWLHGDEGLKLAMSVRRSVFIEEQGVSPEEEQDDIDHTCDHLIILEDGQPVATGRLYEIDGIHHLGRIAVLKQYRGQGLGDLIVRLMLIRGISDGASLFQLGAQLYVRDFYGRFGFAPYGEEFDECGILHINMQVHADGVILPRCCDTIAPA